MCLKCTKIPKISKKDCQSDGGFKEPLFIFILRDGVEISTCWKHENEVVGGFLKSAMNQHASAGSVKVFDANGKAQCLTRKVYKSLFQNGGQKKSEIGKKTEHWIPLGVNYLTILQRQKFATK